MTAADVPMFDPPGGLADVVANQLDEAHRGAAGRATYLAMSAPSKAAARLTDLDRLLDDTDDGDLGREAERSALRVALSTLARCRRCGRELRHPDSVAAGIGPECATKDTP